MRFILLLISLLLVISCSANKAVQPNPAEFWVGDYCVQNSCKTPEAGSDVISAKVNSEWNDYKLVEFPEAFIKWNVGSRLEMLSQIKDMMMGKEGAQPPSLEGPHNGVVATHGFKRDDTQFDLNNAVKGMGFLPKREKIKEIISLLEETHNDPMPKKLGVLESLYQDAENNFALDKQVSLELYSQPKFMTQSFLNQMTNPVCTIVYMDIPSYKLKTIARLLHPDDPKLTEYEKDVVKYINEIHSYFHGEFSINFLATIYYTVEVFDNSPRGKDPKTGMGRKMIPLIP
jgi:hypothetical protein